MTTLESTSERLEDALRRLAVEAADLFEELLATGAEMPFEIERHGGGPAPDVPVRPAHQPVHRPALRELRRLEAYVEVRELSGEEVARGFLIGLWEGRTEFDIAGDRLEAQSTACCRAWAQRASRRRLRVR